MLVAPLQTSRVDLPNFIMAKSTFWSRVPEIAFQGAKDSHGVGKTASKSFSKRRKGKESFLLMFYQS